MQRSDFAGIFRAMDGFPVTIRLLDPPLHEFLPRDEAEIAELAAGADVSVERLRRTVEGLAETNPGTWLGSTSLEDESAPLIESINPATGDVIASVRSATAAEYEQLIAAARESFLEWRKVPAPVRGDAVYPLMQRTFTPVDLPSE